MIADKMSDTIQENTTDATDTTTIETHAKRTRGRKARGGAGDKLITTEKVVKEKKPILISKTWNIPSRRDGAWEQTKIMKYFHSLIKDLAPQLLEMENVRDAYNNLVEFLSTFTNQQFITYLPLKTRCYYNLHKYMGIKHSYKTNITDILGIKWASRAVKNTPEGVSVETECLNFWNIIRPSIWKPLQRAYFEKVCRVRIKNFQEEIEKIDINTQNKIANTIKLAENRKKWYISQINDMLKYDPAYKETEAKAESDTSV